ncbi:MAG: hypothetical protein V3U48_05810 [Rhodospirillales bacterium]
MPRNRVFYQKWGSQDPGKRAEFMLGEMKQGMDTITKIEDSAPMLSALG